MSEEDNVLFEIKDVKKYFPVSRNSGAGRGATLKAVDGVDLTIHEGETLGLVGESGCGKSTLGRSILQLHSITSGQIIYKGEHLENYNSKKMRPLRKHMQMIFQDPYASLSPRMTIYQCVKAPLDVQGGMTEDEKSKTVIDMLDYVGVSEQQFYKYPHELSGGQLQRVAIARAMITNPEFVVCDEPVSALDVSVRAQVLNLMRSAQKSTNMAYLFISHDLSVVKYLCSSVAVMYLGKIVEESSKKEIYANPMHPYTKALMSAIPVPNIHYKKQNIILQGDVPNAVNPPQGCRFNTRCPYATDKCFTDEPKLVEVKEGHSVACHLAGTI